MLRLNVRTKLKPEKVMKKALGYFGPGGHNMKIVEQNDKYISFEGGGGGVQVVVDAGEEKTSVDMLSREWDYQLKEFARSFKS
jgi:hypothetical protein